MADYIKAINYTGQKLPGLTTITKKIDGVRILQRHNRLVTRANKVPPGIDGALTLEAKQVISDNGDCEVFYKDFVTTNSLLQRKEPEEDVIGPEHIFPLLIGSSNCDARLHITTLINPSKDHITPFLNDVVSNGYEGLVLRNRNKWYRYKPAYTADVRITGYKEQDDKYGNPKGVLGGFNTRYGWVTGFRDVDRVELWKNPGSYMGRIIEVEYKEILHTGSFRFGTKFLRFRPDKDTESL